MSARITPWLIAAVAGAPVMAGWVLYLNPGWLPERSVSVERHLVQPVVPVGNLVLAKPSGAAEPLAGFAGNWVLLVDAGRCDEACRQRLWITRQVRRATGMQRSRVSRLLLLAAAPPPDVMQWIEAEHPGLGVRTPPPASPRQVDAVLEGAGKRSPGTVYLVDPMGNLMMRYPPEADAETMLRDIKRLVRVSRHWGSHADR